MRTLLLASVAALGWVGVARADVLRDFDITGSLVDGGSITGDILIDVTSGRVERPRVFVDNSSLVFFSGVRQQTFFYSPDTFAVTFVDTTTRYDLDLAIQGSSLIDYEGGPITFGRVVSNFTSAPERDVASAQLTLTSVAQVPEPASLALLALPAGLAGLVAARRRKG